MRIHNFTLLLLLSLVFPATVSAQKVSQYLNQVITYEQEEKNPPRSMHISLNGDNVELQYVRGSRIMITGKVVLHMSSTVFLESLIKKGRYQLYLSPDGGTGLRLEDKVRRPIILRDEQCREEVDYTIYVPESIETVVLENLETGEQRVIQVGERISRTLAARHQVQEEAPTSSAAPQVQIRDKSMED